MCLFSLHVLYIQCQRQLEEGVGSPGVDGCKPPRGYWEAALGLLQEQQMLVTTAPSLQRPLRLICS